MRLERETRELRWGWVPAEQGRRGEAGSVALSPMGLGAGSVRGGRRPGFCMAVAGAALNTTTHMTPCFLLAFGGLAGIGLNGVLASSGRIPDHPADRGRARPVTPVSPGQAKHWLTQEGGRAVGMGTERPWLRCLPVVRGQQGKGLCGGCCYIAVIAGDCMHLRVFLVGRLLRLLPAKPDPSQGHRGEGEIRA